MSTFLSLGTALVAIIALTLIGYLGAGVAGLHTLFGVVIPYAAIALFLAGFVWRIVRWMKTPVPFNIPTTCGQQQSLDWIKPERIENPQSKFDVVIRMALEVLFFRSLFRNTSAELKDGPKLVYGSNKYLWAAGLAFHYTFLVIFLRHLRFFLEPSPAFVHWMEVFDGFFQIGVPILFISDVIIVAAVSYLFLRRIVVPQIRYISLPADYFPLLLILGIAFSGVLMRYFMKVDLVAVKELTLGLVTFSPVVPESIGSIFYIHVLFVSALFAYFPFSKLMHLGGVFLSPTRNMQANSRAFRHINPWNPEVEVHTYKEWEEEFGDKLKQVGIPLDNEE